MMIASLTRAMMVLMAFGWLAESLAATNTDIDASVAAYENQAWEEALQHLDVATETLGERPELMYNRGLILLATGDKEGARTAFERGTESEHPEVLGSSHYELGNLDFDQGEAWETAIEHYIECLKAMSNHDKAKWNLELARQKQKEAEEQKKKEEEEKQKQEEEKQKQEEEKQDGEEGQDGEKGDDSEEPKDQQDQQEPSSDTDSETPEPESNEDETSGTEEGGDTDEPPQPPESEETGPDEEPDEEPNEEPSPSPKSSEPKQENKDAQNAATQPQAVERVDIGKSLEQLDEQDNFMLGIPSGSKVPVEKDW